MVDLSIIGKRYGYLVVGGLDHVDEKKNSWWRCKCDCGNETVVRRGGLTSGDWISCGCYHREHAKDFSKTHGLTHSPLYAVWGGMIQRCTNKNASNYNRYGGRGITVCEEWKRDFNAFHDWAVSSGYVEGLTLDREDNDKGYTPENCRWVDRYVQGNNTRRNHRVTWRGQTKTLAEWARLLGVNSETLRYRVLKGNMNDFELLEGDEQA